MSGQPSLQTLRLPNGIEISCVDQGEAAVLYREIFTERCWLRNGLELPPDAVVLDVGANIGMASLFFHSVVPGTTVHAFEPAPVPFEALSANLRRHAVPGSAHACAVGATSGEATLTFYPQTTTMSSIYARPELDADNMKVYLLNSGFDEAAAAELMAGRHASHDLTCVVRTVSDIIDELELAVVHLLKVDVERSELDVLLGVRPEHWPRIEQVAAEVDGDGGRLTSMVELLEREGFGVDVSQDPLLRGTEIVDLIARR